MRDATKKRENTEAVAWRDGSDDESLDSSDTDSDSERSIKAVTTTTTTTATSPVTRAQVLSQTGLRVGFSSIPDQIYRKSLRKGGITISLVS